MSSPKNVRYLVLTGAVTAITIAGTLFGAGIKTNKEISKNTLKHQEATFEEQMKALRDMRSNLTARRGMIETQIRDLDARMNEKKQRSAAETGSEHPNEGQ
ncbi:hypothetical protein N7495_007541 [Penicillium taxi]|uniref:uncharacterized protein n=1 Tax=Penicillium taxi TaxID=168475 RepID=UPI0025453175|nr:uncharacterized protein N7495_007541 [Penicillium taxi]KAJ5887500.1 hypothetical protein N7495_007541 [Penicillium taxi]